MAINIKRNENNIELLTEEDTIIETYKVDSEITFEGLIEYLIKLDFETKLNLVKLDDSTEKEELLVEMINRIIQDYNNKVEEFQTFCEEQIDSDK
ncbi:MAG: hypothetical protein ACOCP4_06620 [Candidatus Woesearchaeota archaeon]